MWILLVTLGVMIPLLLLAAIMRHIVYRTAHKAEGPEHTRVCGA